MKLVAGSYERFLWGWQVKEKPASLECVFSYPAHMGPIRCIAGCGSVVATGGADDTVRVFDINAMSDKGSLINHEGAVSCLAFHGISAPGSGSLVPTHLLSGSEDGNICIWDTDSWILLKSFKGGKKAAAVNDLTIHPSGRLALSVYRDAHLRMWDLMKGRCSFTAKLPSEASLIQFSPGEGEIYSLARDSTVEIHNAEDGHVMQTLQHEKRVLCTAMHQGKFLVTGGEGFAVLVWDVRTGDLALCVKKAHANRIKGVAILEGHQNLQSGEFPQMIASASSDGLVRVWDTRMIRGAELADAPTPLMETGTKSRLTCLISCGNLRKKLVSTAEIGEQSLRVSVEAPISSHEEESSAGLDKAVNGSSGGVDEGAKSAEELRGNSNVRGKKVKRKAKGEGPKPNKMKRKVADRRSRQAFSREKVGIRSHRPMDRLS